MLSFLICRILDERPAIMVEGVAGRVLVSSSMYIIAVSCSVVWGYLILKVMSVNAASRMVMIQKRSVIFTS